MATYQYNPRGFRETANYSYGVTSRMNYDAVGNLIHHAYDGPGIETAAQNYELGDHNEVLHLRSEGVDAPDVSYRYDEAGRVFDMQAGDRTASVAYDVLDRAIRVTRDGETLVEYDYASLDIDAATEEDKRTGEVWVPAGTSGVFGTMNSIVYARPLPTEYGPLAYDPRLKTLRVETTSMIPDTILLSSLARRVVPLDGNAANPTPFGHDLPSNSLFIPPEYRSVNCRICNSYIERLTFTSTPEDGGASTRFNATVDGHCETRLRFRIFGFEIFPARHAPHGSISYNSAISKEIYGVPGPGRCASTTGIARPVSISRRTPCHASVRPFSQVARLKPHSPWFGPAPRPSRWNAYPANPTSPTPRECPA